MYVNVKSENRTTVALKLRKYYEVNYILYKNVCMHVFFCIKKSIMKMNVLFLFVLKII